MPLHTAHCASAALRAELGVAMEMMAAWIAFPSEGENFPSSERDAGETCGTIKLAKFSKGD